MTLPYGQTDLRPVRELITCLAAAGIPANLATSPRRASGRGQAGKAAPPLPRIGNTALTSRAIADIIHGHAVAAGLGRQDFAGHSLKRGAPTTCIERGIHPTKLKRLGQHKCFNVLGEYFEFDDLFESHLLAGVA